MAKKSKKMSLSMIFILIGIVICAVAGFFTAQKLTQGDKFELIGEKIIEVEVGGSYDDQGAKVISFGQDLSALVQTENNIDYSTPGEYYIKYSVDNFRFRGIVRFRIIKVVEVASESN